MISSERKHHLKHPTSYREENIFPSSHYHHHAVAAVLNGVLARCTRAAGDLEFIRTKTQVELFNQIDILSINAQRRDAFMLTEPKLMMGIRLFAIMISIGISFCPGAAMVFFSLLPLTFVIHFWFVSSADKEESFLSRKKYIEDFRICTSLTR